MFLNTIAFFLLRNHVPVQIEWPRGVLRAPAYSVADITHLPCGGFESHSTARIVDPLEFCAHRALEFYLQKGQQGTVGTHTLLRLLLKVLSELALISQLSLSDPSFLTSTSAVEGLVPVINPLFHNIHGGSAPQTELGLTEYHHYVNW